MYNKCSKVTNTGPCSTDSNVSDCRSRGPEFDPSTVPYFGEIDHEIISMVVLFPSADSRRVVVKYKRKYVLNNC